MDGRIAVATIVLVAGMLHLHPLASPQQAVKDAPTPIPDGDGIISGRVADRHGNQPLAGAVVHLFSADLRHRSLARTNADGQYLFDGIAAGDYRIVVTHNGYIDQAYGVPDALMARVSPDAVITVNRLAATRVDVSMARAATVMGRVSSEDGRRLGGVKVTLTMVTARGIRVGGRWNTSTTDAGEYVLSNVPEGNFQVSAVWEQEQAGGGSRRAREVYYPGTDRVVEASLITVGAADTLRDIDIVVPVSNLLRIDGTFLRGSSRGPIEAYLLGGVTPQEVPVTSDGRFNTPDLSRGRYTLVARTLSDMPIEATWYTVDLSAALPDLMLALRPTGVIAGTVVADDGSPVPAQLRVAAVLADRGKEIDGLLRDTVAVGADGVFEIHGVFGERVLRVVGGTQGWAVDRVLIGKTPATAVEVRPGSRIDDVQIILTRRP